MNVTITISNARPSDLDLVTEGRDVDVAISHEPDESKDPHVGVRLAEGIATIAPMPNNSDTTMQPIGDHLDQWLSGKLASWIGRLDERSRKDVVTRIVQAARYAKPGDVVYVYADVEDEFPQVALS